MKRMRRISRDSCRSRRLSPSPRWRDSKESLISYTLTTIGNYKSLESDRTICRCSSMESTQIFNDSSLSAKPYCPSIKRIWRVMSRRREQLRQSYRLNRMPLMSSDRLTTTKRPNWRQTRNKLQNSSTDVVSLLLLDDTVAEIQADQIEYAN